MGREEWNSEYESENIPTTNKRAPSRKFLNMYKKIDNREELSQALDIGCGNGRHCKYLESEGFSTIGVDISTKALEEFYTGSECVLADIARGLPLITDSVDIVVDSYSSFHIVDPVKFEFYLEEVVRVLEEVGYFYWCGNSINDEYYGENTIEDNVARDPHNETTKRLYTEDQIKTVLEGQGFKISDSEIINSTDVIDGEEYNREIITILSKV